MTTAKTTNGSSAEKPSRRKFLKDTTSAAVVGGLLAQTVVPRNVHAAGDGLLRVGLVGCGGRGTGAASQALKADPNVKLVALGDAFPEKIQQCLAGLQKIEDVATKMDVPPERCFTGFDAYEKVIEHSDVVLLATPPHFRPLHLKAAVEANKHIFAEKPVAVDAPGVRSVLETCEVARKKGLSVVSGLCLRYSNAHQQMISRLHDGSIGEIRVLQANDFRGPIWVRPREANWSDMEWQMRNWYYFTWLCGDFNVEQHVHLLDVCSWVMNGKNPVRAVGTGGRQVRTGPEFGNIYDHFSVIYEYADGARLFSHCRQQPGCSNDISARAIGSLGTADISERKQVITGPNAWETRGKDNNFYQTEHDELFAGIRKGTPINNGEYMAHSSLLAIMGRMAAYTGQSITWEEAFNSKEDLTPPKYEWGPLETPSVALPGVTKFA